MMARQYRRPAALRPCAIDERFDEVYNTLSNSSRLSKQRATTNVLGLRYNTDITVTLSYCGFLRKTPSVPLSYLQRHLHRDRAPVLPMVVALLYTAHASALQGLFFSEGSDHPEDDRYTS